MESSHNMFETLCIQLIGPQIGVRYSNIYELVEQYKRLILVTGKIPTIDWNRQRNEQ